VKHDPNIYTDPNGDTYLNLFKPNTSGYPVPSRLPWGNSDTSLTTTWTKIRIDLNTLKIDTGDFKFSNSTGQVSHWPQYSTQVPFATAFGCEAPWGAVGVALIDLRGTNFAVKDTFSNDGYESSGNAVFSENNQVVQITGGGYCGWEGPVNAVSQGEEHMHVGGFDLQLVKLQDTSIYTAENGNTYLNLFKPNTSGYPVPQRHPWGISDSSLTTTWTKIRIDLVSLKVDTGDFTYSNSTGHISHWPAYSTQVPYATAFGCESPYGADGSALIDLTGTNYAVQDTFSNGGYLPGGNAVFSQNNQVVKISGGGFCGWEGPANAVKQGEQHMHIGGFDLQLVKLN